MKEYDAIIIGAGNGGLVAANCLALAGKRVLLLEKHLVSGGFATSFVRGRFEFEASLHELCDYGSGANYGNLRNLFKTLGIEDRLEMVDVPEAFRVISPATEEDKSLDFVMPFGIENFINKMEEYVPGSKNSMKTFFELAQEIREAIKYLGESKGKPDVKVLKKKYGNFMRVASYSVKDVLYAIGMPVKAQRILTTYWVYLGAPESKLNFVHYAIMVLLYIDYKAQIPLLRSHDMSLTLEERFKELGGTILHGAKVEEILFYNGRISGVRLENGDQYFAKHIISNAMPSTVYGQMIKADIDLKEQNKVVNYSNLGARGLCIYLGLNKSKEELGIKDYSYFIYNTMDSDEEYKKMSTMDNDSMIAVCLNKAIPDCSPRGTTIMYITSLYFGKCFDEAVTVDNYFDLKNELAMKFIEKFEASTGISIKDYIEEIEVATPVTYAHYTDSPQGVIYGYALENDNSMLARLMTMYDEPVLEGLRFCGGHAIRGSGYNSSYLSGELAANLTLADMNKGVK